MRDGDEYVVNGQKIWSTWANHSQWGILLARTDPDAPKHKGISYFVLDMTTPGIEVRPITEMTGGNHFNEVFFDDVRIPVDYRIGDEGDGWRLANVTLGNERVSLSEGGVLWGMGPTAEECLDEIRRLGAGNDPVMRQRAARAFTESFIIDRLGDKIVDAQVNGRDPGPVASIRKAKADVNAQQLVSLVKDLAGPARHDRHPERRRRGARRVALVVPVQPSPHHRRRHERDPTQHHRRAPPRPPARTSPREAVR